MYKADFFPLFRNKTWWWGPVQESEGNVHPNERQRLVYRTMGLTPIFYDKQTMNTFMLSGLFYFFPWLMNLGNLSLIPEIKNGLGIILESKQYCTGNKKIKGDCLCKVLSLGQMTEMTNANELWLNKEQWPLINRHHYLKNTSLIVIKLTKWIQ